ncbi:hypothetical protein AUEXF2481DRAFT_534372 [Aureobasidium subglaciale EXF-2481]|uniref:Uncharacterized protein n=1 Tax=Aureobasidium subglaciale (strain EXF-2481) TaxID=1043005 RepID=A0A074Y424_AURSE|nr:uncharacterized protein AUEXF2481DRAFT_534372 [Aureobasidium subglaciale EXF-2481]KEQ90684.1 hypothetical protein AUEXF2481DRAFT_534372 [Aureobasidium subglaciale EXF-2481]
MRRWIVESCGPDCRPEIDMLQSRNVAGYVCEVKRGFILLFIMTSNFHPPTRPIVLNSGHIAIHNRTLGLRCHDRRFRDAVVCDEQTDKLFEFTAKDIGTSWTLRRSLVNSTTGQRLLDLRHTKTSYKVCVIEDPDGNEFCKIKDTTSTFSSKFTSVDAQVVGNGGEPTIEMRSFRRER